MNDQILIAGIGNIFLGDDAFGCEVSRELSARALPPKVRVIDYGIRGLDLAYALLDPWQAVVLIDALPRGESPGTLYIFEPDLAALTASDSGQQQIDAHNMDPMKVLRLAASMGDISPNVYLLGCEPEDCGGEEGRMGLSPAVANAMPEALHLIDKLLARISNESVTALANNPYEVKQ
jgi:hydrogenase maturation protease